LQRVEAGGNNFPTQKFSLLRYRIHTPVSYHTINDSQVYRIHRKYRQATDVQLTKSNVREL
jgi:hypothetical protein